MAKDPMDLSGLILLLESISENEAEDTLKRIGIDPKKYGMNKAKELIDQWKRLVQDLTGKKKKKKA